MGWKFGVKLQVTKHSTYKASMLIQFPFATCVPLTMPMTYMCKVLSKQVLLYCD